MAKSSTTFKKGKSGNPGGRSPRIGPNGETAAELARKHTVDAIKTLADGLKAPDWHIRVACSNSLLQRGWGAPKEFIELDATVKSSAPVINLTVTRAAPDEPT